MVDYKFCFIFLPCVIIIKLIKEHKQDLYNIKSNLYELTYKYEQIITLLESLKLKKLIQTDDDYERVLQTQSTHVFSTRN